VGRTDHQDPDAAARRVRGVIERLAREGTAVARSDGTRHDLFPVAASAAEGEALRGWVVREGAPGVGPGLREPLGTPYVRSSQNLPSTHSGE
jgi:hypothetical protein